MHSCIRALGRNAQRADTEERGGPRFVRRTMVHLGSACRSPQPPSLTQASAWPASPASPHVRRGFAPRSRQWVLAGPEATRRLPCEILRSLTRRLRVVTQRGCATPVRLVQGFVLRFTLLRGQAFKHAQQACCSHHGDPQDALPQCQWAARKPLHFASAPRGAAAPFRGLTLSAPVGRGQRKVPCHRIGARGPHAEP
jgi:hypothetical protein